MDSTTDDARSADEFARLLGGVDETPAPASPPRVSPPRAPELLGADELAAGPVPFPPPRASAPPLVAPPAPAPAPAPVSTAVPVWPPPAVPPMAPPSSPPQIPIPAEAASPSPAIRYSPSTVTLPPAVLDPTFASPEVTIASQQGAPPAPISSPALDFAALLQAPVGSESLVRSPGAPLVPAASAVLDEPDIARSTVGEKITLILSILIPPLGLLGAIIAAVRSSQRRGWVIGVVKAALALGIVLSIVVGVGGYVGLRVYRQQQQHNQIAAASAQFCATISADRSMIAPPDFGWPAVAASIPDSLAAMTAYESKWTKLAQVSPAGVKPDVLAIAAAAKQITDSVAVARTIDDASNIAVMTSAASSSGVPAWYSEYCG